MGFPDTSAWPPARLFPVVGIRGQEEQERRATSALLAVMAAVPEFAKSLLGYLRAPAGRVHTYAEVPFELQDGSNLRPDGAVVVERGKTHWGCLVEVKTGRAQLDSKQIEDYCRAAKEHGLDAVLTISNEIAAMPGESPVSVDGRRLRSLDLAHLSWWRILTEAITQHGYRGVSDPDQAWILAEFIEYLQHPKSGAGSFEDLGSDWVAVRDGARHQTLRRGSEATSVVARWEEFAQYLSLGLSQELGRDVLPVYPRKLDQASRRDKTMDELVEDGRLATRLRVPDAVGPIDIRADLRARQLTTSVAVDAPREGRAKTRVNWLLRQLRDADGGLRLEASFVGSRHSASCLLDVCRDQPEALLLDGDHKREPRAFTVALTKEMGRNKGRGDASFVRETERQLLGFYRDIVQDLSPWTPRAPRVREGARTTQTRSPRVPEDPPQPTEGAPPRESRDGQVEIREGFAPSSTPSEPPPAAEPPSGAVSPFVPVTQQATQSDSDAAPSGSDRNGG